MIFQVGKPSRNARWVRRGRVLLRRCRRVVVSSCGRRPPAPSAVTRARRRGHDRSVTANSARTSVPSAILRTHDAHAGGRRSDHAPGRRLCAVAARGHAVAARIDSDAHPRSPTIHLRARPGRRLSTHADHRDPRAGRRSGDAARRPVSRRLDRHCRRSGAAPGRCRRLATGARRHPAADRPDRGSGG